MTEPRDLFLICNNFEESGGLQQWVHGIGRLFSERGHSVHVVGITHAERPRKDLDNLPYRTTVLHERQPAPSWSPRRTLGRLNVAGHLRERRRCGEMATAAAKLSELFRSARPGGVVIAAQVWAMEWVAQADTAGLPVIGMSHESYEASRESSRYARVKTYFKNVDRLLLLTEEDADGWAADGMSNADSMPNPLVLHPTRFPSLDERRLVMLGRLSDEKGADMLLDAWATVAPAHPEWRLRIFGTGPDDERLRRQADALEIAGQVEFKGYTSDVEGALCDASVYVLPSRKEGFPIALMEAMAYGLPTVAFDCAPGVRELMGDEETGLLVRAGDVMGFAAGLERLVKDRKLRQRLGEAARTSVRRYDAGVIVDRWERLFAELYR